MTPDNIFHPSRRAELFEMFRPDQAIKPVTCAECGAPALRHEFGRDWCLDCLGQVEKEMNDLADNATAQEKAVAEEIDRLKRLQKHDWRGTPHEL